jgi:hypothetical protein
VVTSVQRAPDEVTALQVVLAGSALVVDVAIAVVLAVVLWPVGAAIAIFPLSVAGALVARRRARFRALAALVAAVHVVIGAALFLVGGLALAASGVLLAASAIAPAPENGGSRWAKARGHAMMIVVAALVLLALAPWAAGLWPD